MTVTVQRIADTIKAAQAENPGLRVIVTDDCEGRSWVVDSCCSVVYISSRLQAGRFVAALGDAVRALRRDLRRHAGPPLRLVRAGDLVGGPVLRGTDGEAFPVDPGYVHESCS